MQLEWLVAQRIRAQGVIAMKLCKAKMLRLTLLGIAASNILQAQTEAKPGALVPPLVAVSPIKATQGYATDGSVHYMFSSTDIAAYDKDWHLLWQNKSPFESMPPGVAHIGDGDVYQGEIYAPVETYKSCDDNTQQRIAIYDAKDGSFKRYTDLSGFGHEVSAVTIVPSTQSMYVSSFCESDRVYQYDLKTMRPLAPLLLSAPITKIQGIAWSEKRKQFAITSDSPPQKIGYIWGVSPTGRVSLLYTIPQTGELEGVDYSQDQIRYLMDNLWFLSPEVGRTLDPSETWKFGMPTTGAISDSQAASMGKLVNDVAELERYRKDNTALKPGEDRIVFYGDSITDAWGNRPDKWPFFAGKGYIDRGISGQTTAQMLIRFRQDVIDLHPKVVLLLAGTNDIAGNLGPASLQMVADNITSMVQLAHANGIRIVLCATLPADHFSWRKDAKPAEPIRELNAWMKHYAAEQKLVYVDYYAALTNANGGMKEGTSLDGVHPTAAGYAIMEPLAEKGIAEAMQRKP
jgi:acyl-CoA thioesterase-1